MQCHGDFFEVFICALSIRFFLKIKVINIRSENMKLLLLENLRHYAKYISTATLFVYSRYEMMIATIISELNEEVITHRTIPTLKCNCDG